MTGGPQPIDVELFRRAIEQTKDYALFLLDTTGHIITWNTGAAHIKGYLPAEIIGRHFSTFYTRESVDSGWPDHELKVASAEGRFEDEGWRVRKDGSRFWASVVITALRDEEGNLLGFSKITRDLTLRKREEETLRQSEERFRLLVEGVTDYSIFMLDPEGTVTSWNIGAQRISGYTRDEIVGKHFSRFYPAEDAEAGRPWQELARARKEGRAEEEGWRVKKNGERYWARVIVNALFDGAGQLRGFAKITQDLSERRHLVDLEKATKNLNEFLAILAHELRNPLAPIRSAVKVMARTSVTDADKETMRQTIDRQSAHLQRIVDDMLDIARMTRGKLDIQRQSVDLCEAVRHAIEMSKPFIDAARHSLDTEMPERAVMVRGDLQRLAQLLANLLNNAARYTPIGGRIRIVLRTDDGKAIVKVQDTGQGIEPESMERIFDMFVRGREPVERPGEGLGVGLALARKIAELHNGTLVVRSEGENKGSEFTLQIPLDTAPGRQMSSGTDPTALKMAGRNSRRVLVVDDNVDAADSLHALLSSLGHETLAVYSGAQALRAAVEFRPDVVLLDIGMPGLDGFEVARRLRALKMDAPLRIIAVTGWGQPADQQKSREAGFDLHLVKPVDHHELAQHVSALSGSKLH